VLLLADADGRDQPVLPLLVATDGAIDALL